MNTNTKMKFTVSNVLARIGVEYQLDGAKYLARAVHMTIDHPQCMRLITKQLYTPIAKEFGTKPINVERSIRNAIDKAWDTEKIFALKQIFGPGVCNLEKRPSNGKLIALLAERIPYIMD